MLKRYISRYISLYQAGKGVENTLKTNSKQGKQSEITLIWLPLESALLAQHFLVRKFFIYIYLDKRSNLKDSHLTFALVPLN